MQQRFAIASLQLPKSDRIPSTSQTANCLQQRFAIAPPQPSKQRRTPSTSQTANCLQQRFAIAPPQPPKQRTACSSASLSHTLNSPTSFFNEPLQTQRTQRVSRKVAKEQRRKESHFSPISFFNEPRRREEHEGRREEKSDRIAYCIVSNETG
ncbi:hypothetical protein [Dolichospermum sp. UHCC 0352]|uniref:hypothetical protein n=1 Tax=Dolichospermum sp. UHCC 0352 TaxID=2590011 RepID=UPI001C2C1E21|nr:hypothetical protein [Dolichospermum sp. UHCC 0352]